MVTRDKQNLTIETLSLSNLYIYHVHIAELMMLQSLSPCQVLKNASELPVSCHR